MIDKLDKMSELKYVSICLLLSALTSTFAYLAAQEDVVIDVSEEVIEEAFAPDANFDDNDSQILVFSEKDCEKFHIHVAGGE